MEQREKDIQKVCRQVLIATPNIYHNPNGVDQSTCPFCNRDVEYITYEISNIRHNVNCAYVIAKDLLT